MDTVQMDTSVESMPAHEADEDAWKDWLNHHPVYRESQLTCNDHGPRGGNLPDGGVIAMASDHVLGALGMRVVPTGRLPATATLNVLYHARAYPPLGLRATLLNAGRNVLAIRVEAQGFDDRVCSTASGTMAVSSLQRRTERLDMTVRRHAAPRVPPPAATEGTSVHEDHARRPTSS
jgi:acyl-coenzyme A thioesterase PaaI-like protein